MASNKRINPSEKEKMAKKSSKKAKQQRTFFDGLEESLIRVFRWFSSLIDKVFFSTKHLPLFALIGAILMYLGVTLTNEANLISSLSSAKTLNDIAVSARYNSESFEVSGIPTSCNVVITGEAANVNNAATKSGYCLLNLEGLTEGTHTVTLSAVGYGDAVTAVITPSETQVTLKKKTTGQFDLSYDFINTNLMDSKFILGAPTFSTGASKINIRASQDTLDSISLVKTLIDVSGQTADFTIEAPLIAYDKNGKVVNAEIVPSSVNASVSVTSPSKVVPISMKFTGTAPIGYSISSVAMDRESATIYAAQSVLDSIEEVFVSLDLSTISGDTELAEAISLPAGVSAADVSMVNLKVSLAPTESKTIQDVPIVYMNNVNGYGASSIETAFVDVTVSGSSEIIEKINENNFAVYIDVDGLTPGDYTLPLNIATSSSIDFPDIVDESDMRYVVLTLSQPDIKITLVEK